MLRGAARQTQNLGNQMTRGHENSVGDWLSHASIDVALRQELSSICNPNTEHAGLAGINTVKSIWRRAVAVM